jgi:hypothetical protein
MLRDERSANGSQRVASTTRDWLLRRNSGEVAFHPLLTSSVVSSRLILPCFLLWIAPARSTRGQTESLTLVMFHPHQRQCISLLIRTRLWTCVQACAADIVHRGLGGPLAPGEVKRLVREHSAAGPTVTRTARTHPRHRERPWSQPPDFHRTTPSKSPAVNLCLVAA